MRIYALVWQKLWRKPRHGIRFYKKRNSALQYSIRYLGGKAKIYPLKLINGRWCK